MSHLDRKHLRGRRGSVYLMVLATTTVIATLVSGTVYVQTQRLRSERASGDASKARLAAECGIEVARAWIRQDANWRATRSSGRWATNLVMGDAKVDLDVIDTVDGNLANHPYHGVLITSTARVGDAEQIMSAALAAKPYPIDALSYAVHSAGQLHVESAGKLILGSATASTAGALRNEATIEGNARAATVTTAGTVFGTLTNGAVSAALPDAAAAEAVALLGTTIAISSKKSDTDTFSTTANPYGSPNSRGVYVIRASDDIEVRDINMTGTLVIFAPGDTVTFNKTITMAAASSDLPALIVVGDANFTPDSGTISGLIHVTGKLTTNGKCSFRGAVLVGSTASSNALDVSGVQTVNYDPGLVNMPPVGYAKSVDMALVPGSVQRVVK